MNPRRIVAYSVAFAIMCVPFGLADGDWRRYAERLAFFLVGMLVYAVTDDGD